MRMKRTMMSLMHRDTRGAVAVIVAIALVVFLGFLVLTVDLGGLVATKRAMVRAADSAALAAAQACAGSPAQSPGTPESYADQYAMANTDLATLDSSAVNIVEFGAIVGTGGGGFTYVPGVNNCQNGQPGYVVVEYTGTQDLFFARIFGAGTGDVAATATAIWAHTTNPGIVPWVVTVPRWTGCVSGTEPCEFAFPPQGSGNPSWGIMDWSRWGDFTQPENVAQGQCSINSGVGTWAPIWDGTVRLDDPEPPQWVCFDEGRQVSDEWERLEGGIWAFPLADEIRDMGPGRADFGHIVDFKCMSVPIGGVTKNVPGPGMTIRMVPEDTCFVSGELDPDILGLGPQGARLVE